MSIRMRQITKKMPSAARISVSKRTSQEKGRRYAV
jgi:hypothetical protein